MAAEYSRHGGSVIAVEEVPPERTSSYGIVAIDSNDDNRITRIVEKPKPENAPSNMGVVGRYLLDPRVFDKLETTGRGAGGEIQLTDAISDLLDDLPVHAHNFSGERFDCGSKLGYLKATVAYALDHPELSSGFREHLRELNLQ